MKKIGKKLSYFTKVLLVLGLIISNLSSLSVVFAYEGEDENTDVVNEKVGEEVLSVKSLGGFDATVDEEGKLTITYAGEINDTDELNLLVSEVYTYRNCEVTESVLSCDVTKNNTYTVDEANRTALSGDGMQLSYTLMDLSQAKFDGTYKLIVSLVNKTNDNSSLGEKELVNKENNLASGIEFKLYDNTDTLINKSEDKYVIGVEKNLAKVVGKMLAGGISPNDVFVYGEDEQEYSASEFLNVEFKKEFDLTNYLYGNYTLSYDIPYLINGETVTYTEHFNISHGTYEDNTNKLNTYVDSSKMLFDGKTQNGHLYVYLGDTPISVGDIDKVLSSLYGTKENIEYVISNSDGSNVLAEYNEEGEETRLEYLNKIGAEAGMKVTITDGLTTITYETLVVGDINGDNFLDEDDVTALIDQIVGNEELNLDKANINDSDDEVNVLDVIKLDQIVKNGTWGIKISEVETVLDAQLRRESEETITSGDEFDVNYVLINPQVDILGFAGMISYDKAKLKLVSIKAMDQFKGSDKDGKFIYISNVDKDTTPAETTTSDEEEVTKLLTLKFKALSAGDSTITVQSPEYFNGDTYYKIVEINEETGESAPTTQVISLDVTVNKSSDNSLASLMLGDNEIKLEDGVYDYELTVGNDVVKLDVSAVAFNSAASIVSIISPEELVEGENTVTVTVISEDGTEQVYTVIVTKEKAPEVAPSNDNQTGYQNYNYNNNQNNGKQQNPPKNDEKNEPEPVAPVKEKSNLSKIIIIVLILLVIAGLIYLIFKDDDDDEAKKANKDINKFKKEDFDSPKIKNTTNNNNKNRNQNKNNKKER